MEGSWSNFEGFGVRFSTSEECFLGSLGCTFGLLGLTFGPLGLTFGPLGLTFRSLGLTFRLLGITLRGSWGHLGALGPRFEALGGAKVSFFQ